MVMMAAAAAAAAAVAAVVVVAATEIRTVCTTQDSFNDLLRKKFF